MSIYGGIDMKLCRHCKWSEPCICVVCEEGTTLICPLKNKHVEKDDPGCDVWEEDENKEEKGYYKKEVSYSYRKDGTDGKAR
jgi:hypothetical protein